MLRYRIQFASNKVWLLPFECPYPNGSWLVLKLSLASAIGALFGKDASKYTFACHDVYPLKDQPMSYVSTREYVKPLNSGNDHQNINLALSMVNKITQPFLPAAWEQSYSHSAFKTCPLMNYNGGDYEVAKLRRYNINRGSIRFRMDQALGPSWSNMNQPNQHQRAPAISPASRHGRSSPSSNRMPGGWLGRDNGHGADDKLASSGYIQQQNAHQRLLHVAPCCGPPRSSAAESGKKPWFGCIASYSTSYR